MQLHSHVNSRQTSEVLGASLRPGLDFGALQATVLAHGHAITTRRNPSNDKSMMGLFNLCSLSEV